MASQKRQLKRKLDRSFSTTESEAAINGNKKLKDRSAAFMYAWSRLLDFDDYSKEEVTMALDQHEQLCKEERMLIAETFQSLVDRIGNLTQRRREKSRWLQKRMKLLISQHLQMDMEMSKEQECLKEVKEEMSKLEELLKTEMYKHFNA